MQMHRSKMSRGQSKRSFTRGTRTNTKNGRTQPMRGGYRL